MNQKGWLFLCIVTGGCMPRPAMVAPEARPAKVEPAKVEPAKAAPVAKSGPPLVIDNRVAECMPIRVQDTDDVRNLTTLHVAYQLKKNLGECGCKSRGLSYRLLELVALEEGEPSESERVHGTFVPREESGVAELVLSTDRQSPSGPPLKLQLGCRVD